MKANVGIKNGRTFAIDKADNPGIQSNVAIPTDIRTKVIAGEGKIVTVGDADTHIHWICPQQAQEVLVPGVMTMIGDGTGPTTGTHATTCTPGLRHIMCMLQTTDTLPVNIGLLSKDNGSNPDALREQVGAGTIGLKTHEDQGVAPTAIDCALTVANKVDIQVALHNDILNESGFVEDTLAAIGDRTTYTSHIEGAGGGHAPDIITVCTHPNILSSSTNLTLPYTVNIIDEHLDMLMVCHHLNSDIVGDVAFVELRVRRKTIATGDTLYDIDAFPLTSPNSQAVGRVGEMVLRTRQVAHRIEVQRDPLAEETGNDDNPCAKRYVAKYTINPALTHGIAHEVGSVEPGKLADLVLWSSVFFGVKPATIVKDGMVAYAPMGDINTSIPTPQPMHYRMMFGVLGVARHRTRLTPISQAADAQNISQRTNLQSAIAVIRGCRTVKRADMIHNGLQPNITIDAQTYEVRIDGEPITSEPADALPMTRCYSLFWGVTMIYLTQRFGHTHRVTASVTLPIDVQVKSRAKVALSDDREAGLMLPRGLLLRGDDLLNTKDSSEVIEVTAAPESVSVMRCADPFLLAKVCYHLGDRHVPPQILADELRYHHDHVLDDMPRRFNLRVTFARLPFGPEVGTYASEPHGHCHGRVH